MCSPSAWLTAISVVVTAASAQQSAQAQKRAGEYQQQVAAENKKLSELKAQDELNQGAEQAAQLRRQNQLRLGAQRAAIAANNLDLQTGTSLDILGDTALFGAVDERRALENSRRRAWGYRLEGQNYQWQGDIAGFNARTGAQATYLNAASNITGTAANYYGRRG